jgi:glycosyltransferase involved in cell wall biosynthesis
MSERWLGLHVRRRARFDVVFYMPFIGWILSDNAPFPPGGAETQILGIARGLAKLGARVAIVAYGGRDELPSHVDGVRIIPRPPSPGHKRLVGKLLEAIRIWQTLSRSGSRTVVYRCANGELGLIAAYVRIVRRRLIFSTANVVDFEIEKLTPKRRDLLLYKLGVRLADSIVVQTEEQVELCTRAFGRRPVLINSIATPSATKAESPEAFLWVGRLVSYKRPLEYIALARALPEARFWMVGVASSSDYCGLSLPDEVRAAASELPNLELLPPRSHAGIQELMSRAVASVNTADFEGMPNVLLEAWSLGVPALVLAHDPGGVVATYRLGGFANGSRERLVELAREQWRSRHDREELALRCRAYLDAHHAPEMVLRGWLDVLAVEPPPAAVPRPAAIELTCVE